MTQRIHYPKQSPELFNKFVEFSMALRHSSIEEPIHDLVNVRASQINDCALCLDMHVKEATIMVNDRSVCIKSPSGASPHYSPRASARIGMDRNPDPSPR